MEIGNLFTGVPDNIPDEIFNEIVSTENIRIERIVSKGHSSPETGWYDQEKNEWVMVMKGEAELTFENGKRVRLSGGNYINIPAHEKHKVSWTAPDRETVWLAVHY